VGASGHALHLGVDQRHPDAFGQGLFPRLYGCARAARAMEALAREHGFVSEPVRERVSDVTRAYLDGWLAATAATARAGDTVLLTFAGHGALVPGGGRALVLYDGWVADDTIDRRHRSFRAGVRIVWILDCCHGGGFGSHVADAAGRPVARAPLDADLLVLAAGPSTARVPAARADADLPPFTSRLLDAMTKGARPRGWSGLRERIGGNAELSGLLHDDGIRLQEPFAIRVAARRTR
jgi:hypothetical protein